MKTNIKTIAGAFVQWLGASIGFMVCLTLVSLAFLFIFEKLRFSKIKK